MPQTKTPNPKNHISTEGCLEPECASRICNKLDALEDFVMDIQNDICHHINLSPSDYDRMLKMNDEEIEQNNKKELNILNRLQWVVGEFGSAKESLVKLIEEQETIPNDRKIEDSKSYR